MILVSVYLALTAVNQSMWMSDINDVPMVMKLLSYFSRYRTWHTDRRTYIRTDSHVTAKIFEIDGLPNFLRYGAPLVHFRRAAAPL